MKGWGFAVLGRYIFIWLLCVIHTPVDAQAYYPNKQWQVYQNPEDMGWSIEKLNGSKRYADSIGLAAVMIIYKGAVLSHWGDIERKYLVHSMRKSFLNALYGMSEKDGTVSLNETLDQLQIDDTVNPLTEEEKQANVKELLQSRSGIFLPAAYEGNPEKPKRGSHPHGRFWLYNNWDFNVLGTILEKKTGKKFFDDLQERLAKPLAMEDVDSLDGHYVHEPKRSQHAAYTFKMSTRDLARFGLLYASNGLWKGKQLVPMSWIEESTKAYSMSDDGLGLGYGYLWWVDQTIFKERGMYSAAGMGGHHIFIFPKDSLVIVVRADTYKMKFVPLNAEYQFLSKILEAKEDKAVSSMPKLSLLPSLNQKSKLRYQAKLDQNRYIGYYQFEGEWMKVIRGANGLLMDTEFMGTLYLQPINESLFLIKDQESYISFVFDKSGKAIKRI
jgi:CubicO group peptidase (beta-lactamase class C family)